MEFDKCDDNRELIPADEVLEPAAPPQLKGAREARIEARAGNFLAKMDHMLDREIGILRSEVTVAELLREQVGHEDPGRGGGVEERGAGDERPHRRRHGAPRVPDKGPRRPVQRPTGASIGVMTWNACGTRLEYLMKCIQA